MVLRMTVLVLAAVILVTGCGTSKEALTGKAVGCPTRDVNILPSEYARKGMDTSWCAACKNKRYQCVTNADRTRTSCKETNDGDGCL